jgi:sialate O-acetylesterase
MLLRLAVGFALICAAHAQAEIRLPALFSDHAMLQAGKPVAIWGWAEPGAKVSVDFDDGTPRTASPIPQVVADSAGKWSTTLPANKAGTAGKLVVTSDKGSSATVNDVLVGEVWLGGGQSNMTYDIGGKAGGIFDDPVEAAQIKQNIVIAQQEADAIKPPIRYFKVTSTGSDTPTDDVKGQWVLADDKNVAEFSATAWNFGVALFNKLHVPIGLIVSAVGGTPVEAWMSKETLEGTSVGAAVMARNAKNLAGYTPEKLTEYQNGIRAWYAANSTPQLQKANAASRPKEPYTPTHRYVPTRLYNGMIHGLEPYTLRGVIWFQADGNMAFPLEYSELFVAMIKQWRTEWNEPALPFYFVEMNNMREPPHTGVEFNNLSIIREQQHGALTLPGVNMVCSIDVGTANAHFPNKKPVGERLAGLALRDCYQMPGLVESPQYLSFSVEGNAVRLKFSHADGLRLRQGVTELQGFSVRAADVNGPWLPATGKIEGQDIVIQSSEVPAPAAVRYAWAPNPITSVENSAGLPLVPFRTDKESPK